MRVAALAAGLKHSRLLAPAPDTEITGMTNDSRRVGTRDLYAALHGLHLEGHDYIPDAIRAGATAILCEKLPRDPARSVAWFVAPQARIAMSELAARLYRDPSGAVPVVGITGTDGKTSTVSFTHQLLRAIAGPSAYLSTAAMQIGDVESPNLQHQSTPESPEVHRILRSMVDAGAESIVLESTSHGLSRLTARLAHVRYRVAVLTNLSHEHLEFHGTFDRYRDDKTNLFRALDSGCYADAPQAPSAPRDAGPTPRFPIDGPFGVVNVDDASAPYFAGCTHAPIVGYGLAAGAHVTARSIELSTTGSRFTLVTPLGEVDATIPVPGGFNIHNTLAAVSVAQGMTGCDPRTLADAIARLRPVRGRMTVVADAPFSVVVDYAHTPGSFEMVLPFFREHASGRVIVLFGSAGDRDVAKRPLQAAVADRYADVIVLADEDPRSEEPMSILREIASGCPNRTEGEDLFLVPDRRLAIRAAMKIARPGDTVLLLGKGHEATIIGRTTVAWDEIEVAREEASIYQ